MKKKKRILSKILIDETTGCWDWQGCIQSNGYARVTFEYVTMGAHRLSYLAFKGLIPKGHDVCHKCDNRKCVNPEHLFIGTRLDNMKDAVSKSRQSKGDKLSIPRRGDKSYLAKLTWGQVREIRASTLTTRQLANIYHVSADNIRRIKNNNTWREHGVA